MENFFNCVPSCINYKHRLKPSIKVKVELTSDRIVLCTIRTTTSDSSGGLARGRGTELRRGQGRCGVLRTAISDHKETIRIHSTTSIQVISSTAPFLMKNVLRQRTTLGGVLCGGRGRGYCNCGSSPGRVTNSFHEGVFAVRYTCRIGLCAQRGMAQDGHLYGGGKGGVHRQGGALRIGGGGQDRKKENEGYGNRNKRSRLPSFMPLENNSIKVTWG